MNWKKPLERIHLTAVMICLMLAIFCIVIVLPIQTYDYFVVKNAKECAKIIERGDESDWVDDRPARDKVNGLFAPPTKKELLENLSDEDLEKIASGKEFDWDSIPPANNVTRKRISQECGVEYTKYGQQIISNKTIWDNSPSLLFPIISAGVCALMAAALIALKKWIIWVFKQD